MKKSGEIIIKKASKGIYWYNLDFLIGESQSLIATKGDEGYTGYRVSIEDNPKLIGHV